MTGEELKKAVAGLSDDAEVVLWVGDAEVEQYTLWGFNRVERESSTRLKTDGWLRSDASSDVLVFYIGED